MRNQVDSEVCIKKGTHPPFNGTLWLLAGDADDLLSATRAWLNGAEMRPGGQAVLLSVLLHLCCIERFSQCLPEMQE